MSAKLDNVLEEIKDFPLADLLTLQEKLVQQVRQRAIGTTAQPIEKRKWPEGFLEKTYGSLKDEPLTREYEGDFEEREPLL